MADAAQCLPACCARARAPARRSVPERWKGKQFTVPNKAVVTGHGRDAMIDKDLQLTTPVSLPAHTRWHGVLVPSWILAKCHVAHRGGSMHALCRSSQSS